MLSVLSVELPPEPSSATLARTLTRERVAESCTDDTLDTVALLVTELVTNAILHAHTPLVLTVEARPGRLRITVADRSTARPELRHAEPDTGTGRGLVLVDRLASTWGVDATPTGKAVWCEVRV